MALAGPGREQEQDPRTLVARERVAFVRIEAKEHAGRRLHRLACGGEAGPMHSAGLVIVSDVAWPVTDLRVDWSEEPVADLTALWRLWRPQVDAYRIRALDPAAAPNYGVPGDEDLT